MQADHEPVNGTPSKGSLPKRGGRRAARAAQFSRLWAISEESSPDAFAALADRLRELEDDPGAHVVEQV